MSRERIKDGKLSTFNLSQEEKDLIRFLTNQHSFSSQSEFIGWLVRNYHATKDPLKEMEIIKQEKSKLTNQIKELEEKEQQTLHRMKAYQEDQKEKETLVLKAVRILKRKIVEGEDRFSVEETARFWAFRLNKDIKELLFKAYSEFTDDKQRATTLKAQIEKTE
jgi:hypothetical protein